MKWYVFVNTQHMIKSYENNFFPGSELTLLYKRAIKHTATMHSERTSKAAMTLRELDSHTSGCNESISRSWNTSKDSSSAHV